MSEALPYLPDKQFCQVIASTPLVSIDLILLHKQQVLLGQRINRPAQGFWFVPGGRIRKNESISAAFSRITLAELGQELDYAQAKLLGAFDHFYSDSVFGEAPSTHYVALGFSFELSRDVIISSLPFDQHEGFSLWDIDHASSSEVVHFNTKQYIEYLREEKL